MCIRDRNGIDKDNSYMLATLFMLQGDLEAAEMIVKKSPVDPDSYVGKMIAGEMKMQVEMIDKAMKMDDGEEADYDEFLEIVSVKDGNDSEPLQLVAANDSDETEPTELVSESSMADDSMVKGTMAKDSMVIDYVGKEMDTGLEGKNAIEYGPHLPIKYGPVLPDDYILDNEKVTASMER